LAGVDGFGVGRERAAGLCCEVNFLNINRKRLIFVENYSGYSFL